MGEEESRTTPTFPPTRQSSSLVTFSLVTSQASSSPVTSPTWRVSSRTSWRETVSQPALSQNIFRLPRIGRFRKDDLVRVREEEAKKVEDITTSDFITASIDSDSHSMALGEIWDIAIVNDNTARVTVKQANTEDALLTCQVDQPFFIFCAGWASLFPLLTRNKYGLSCKVLSRGDIIMVARDKQKGDRRQDLNTPMVSSWATKDKTETQIRKDSNELSEEDDEEQPTDLSVKRWTVI